MNNKRQLILIILLIVILVLQFAIIYDRTQTRQMLDARANIQVLNVKGNIKAGTISPAEVEKVKELWQQAEYDRVAPLIDSDNKDGGEQK